MYFIFYQYFDDAQEFHAETIEKINEYMKRENLYPEDVILIKGEMVSGWDNKHWPTKFKRGRL